MIVARDATDPALQSMAEKVNQGVRYYQENPEEAVQHITSTMRYSGEDAKEWMKTVRFADDVRGVDPGVADETVAVLQKAGVLVSGNSGGAEHMVAIKRAERGRMT